LSATKASSAALQKPAKAEAATKKSASKKVAPENHRLSCNSSTETELAKGKGISAKLARAIVDGRPFASFDDLLKVKGMGPKLLEKLRATLGL
jgi:competence ComEA-like helix-hairpin-helix protein